MSRMRRKSATTAAVSVAPLFGEIRHGYAAHVSAFPMSSPSRGDRGCLPERPGRDGGCRGDPGIRGGSPPREAGAAPGALLPPCPARRGGGGAAAGSWRRREGGRPSEKSHCLGFCHKPREYLILFISGVFIIIQISSSIN